MNYVLTCKACGTSLTITSNTEMTTTQVVELGLDLGWGAMRQYPREVDGLPDFICPDEIAESVGEVSP